MSNLVLIRGLPGSGKSTLAQGFVKTSEVETYHREADMFHIDDYGHYNFIASNIKAAHEWCLSETKRLLRLNCTVVVSNTFTQMWEMQPYIDLAKEFGISITVLHCENNFGNIHNVPEEVIAKMKARWEPYEVNN